MKFEDLVQQMKNDIIQLGAQELRTPADVDAVIPHAKGTMLVVVNSTCGCASGTARPALRESLHHPNKPDKLVTVFATTDREATARVRQYFPGQPPSSPSFALMKDGKLVTMIHRSQIKDHSVEQVARELTDAYDRHCTGN